MKHATDPNRTTTLRAGSHNRGGPCAQKTEPEKATAARTHTQTNTYAHAHTPPTTRALTRT